MVQEGLPGGVFLMSGSSSMENVCRWQPRIQDRILMLGKDIPVADKEIRFRFSEMYADFCRGVGWIAAIVDTSRSYNG